MNPKPQPNPPATCPKCGAEVDWDECGFYIHSYKCGSYFGPAHKPLHSGLSDSCLRRQLEQAREAIRWAYSHWEDYEPSFKEEWLKDRPAVKAAMEEGSRCHKCGSELDERQERYTDGSYARSSEPYCPKCEEGK